MNISAGQSSGLYHISSAVLEELAERLSDSEGYIDETIYSGDDEITFTGNYEMDGYVEDDYYNGTGAYVMTRCCISFDCSIIGEDGNRIATDWSDKEFEDFLKN